MRQDAAVSKVRRDGLAIYKVVSGDFTLLKGDCIELMASIPDESIDSIVSDLPYGTTQCDWDRLIDFPSLWHQYERILKTNGVMLFFSAQPFTSQLITSRPDLYRYLWYWEKEKGTNFFRVGRQPLRVIEEIVIFARNASYTYNPQLIPLDKPYRHTMPLKHSAITGKNEISPNSQTAEEREYKTYTHRQPINLLKFPRDNANKSLIPTQKPVALTEYLIRTYRNEGDLILDPTMGSGTTGVACLGLHRKFIGMELYEKHFEIAKKRIICEIESISAPVDRYVPNQKYTTRNCDVDSPSCQETIPDV